jgi:flagellar assembly protein FliH
MTARPRFLFDEDFGAPKKAPEQGEPTLSVALHQAEVQRAEEAAFRRGAAEGRRQALEDETARLSACMQRLALQFAEATSQFAEVADRAELNAASLAVIMARKLAATLVERQPLAEIEAVARRVFAHLRATPHVVMRVHASLVEAVKPRLDAIAGEAGFTGAIVVMGEPDIGIGDARIEWADGGTARDRTALERMLEEVVRRYLASPRREEKKS